MRHLDMIRFSRNHRKSIRMHSMSSPYMELRHIYGK